MREGMFGFGHLKVALSSDIPKKRWVKKEDRRTDGQTQGRPDKGICRLKQQEHKKGRSWFWGNFACCSLPSQEKLWNCSGAQEENIFTDKYLRKGSFAPINAGTQKSRGWFWGKLTCCSPSPHHPHTLPLSTPSLSV